MTLSISSTEMTSDITPHTAYPVEGGWEVSWMPGTVLDRNEATTAMKIAEEVIRVNADDPTPATSRALIRAWCRELDTDPQKAMKILSN